MNLTIANRTIGTLKHVRSGYVVSLGAAAIVFSTLVGFSGALESNTETGAEPAPRPRAAVALAPQQSLVVVFYLVSTPEQALEIQAVIEEGREYAGSTSRNGYTVLQAGTPEEEQYAFGLISESSGALMEDPYARAMVFDLRNR